MRGRIRARRSLAIVLTAALAAAAALPAAPAAACVGRTIAIGYYDTPDQALVAALLSVFIDERTGTTVTQRKFRSREEAFAAIRQDRISLFVDYSGIVLAMAGERPEGDEGKTLAHLKDVLNRKYNVVWIDPVGYDRYFTEKAKAGERPGPAGMMLCKDSLAKFPALPRLLSKLRGVLDNATMASLLREAEVSDAKAVARRFLKSRKLI